MESDTNIQKPTANGSSRTNITRLKIAGAILSIGGIALFSYLVYSVGPGEIFAGISKVGLGGFLVILMLYLVKISIRATAWRLSVYSPYKLDFKDTLPAVIIGEALSSMIPLGILISGTAKAVAVRRRLPLVVGLSSVATENLFYSLVTGLFISFGAFAFLRRFPLDPGLVLLIDFIIGFILLCIIIGFVIVIRQWHWASGICDILYKKGILTGILESGRLQVRLFENLIYSFYRKYPRRFFPILLCQVGFHTMGVLEVWFILTRIGDAFPQLSTAFFLETVSRLITIVFKLIPFLVGVDEAGAEFVTETLAIGAGLGITLAIIRKGRIIFWTAVGLVLMIKRGLTFKEIKRISQS